MNMTRATGALLLATLLAPMAGAQDNKMPPAPVGVVAARQESLSPSRWVPGTVISREDSRVAAEVAGNLVSVLEVGTQVKKGESLARLNDREMQLELRNNETQVARLTAQLDYLKRQVQRLTTLTEQNTAAIANLDESTAQRDMLVQELEGAKVARDRTLYNIERARIAAPFDGVVVERIGMPGEFIDRGTPVVRLVNTRSLEIRVQAPLDVVRHVRAGDTVAVSGSGGEIRTTVQTVVPVGDEVSRMLELRLALPDPRWIIGEAVRVSVNHGGGGRSITVPRDSLVLREGETYLYKVLPDNTARKVVVTVGDGAGDRVSVSGDVADGDRIVIRGAERLQDGAPVRVVGGDA